MGAFSQDVAYAPSLGNHIDEGQNNILVAKLYLQAVTVFPGQEALFITFHGKGDGAAGADGIDGVFVAQLVGLGQEDQIIDLAQGTKGGNGLILGSAVFGIDGDLPRAYLHSPFTPDGTGITAFPSLQDGFGHGFPRYPLCRLQLSIVKVTGRKDPPGI